MNYSPEFSAPEPNLPLLKRLAESGQGKLLDPLDPDDSPFLHDRKKTFQPWDLWEWLVKAALLLFVLDVGIRRIQIDREEWAKWLAVARRGLFFWRTEPRAPEAEESLAALLARRGQARSRQEAAPIEPSPELFQPASPPAFEPARDDAPAPIPETQPPEEAAASEEKPGSTASRLLEANAAPARRWSDGPPWAQKRNIAPSCYNMALSGGKG